MPRRISSAILIMLLLLNGSGSIMVASGLAEDIGMQLNPGMEQTMDELVNNAQRGFSPNSGPGETLFAMFGAALDTFTLLVQGVFAAPEMFINLGFPAWFVAPVFAPMYLVVTLDLIAVGSGRTL